MLFSIALLIVVIFLAYKAAPKEKDDEHAHVHGAGQIGLAAAIALFGVDYFTSFYYGTGELMSALHPYGLQDYGYIAAGVIAIANFVFGALYMYSLGVFNEGGGSYTASMRYLKPTLSLIVAVTLIEDYVLTIVVSALSGGDQLLSLFPQFYENWWLHFLIGAVLAFFTWFVTIRGRGESSTVVFTMLGMFAGLTVLMAIGLFMAHFRGVPPAPATTPLPATFGQAILHLLTASMKGMVALSGLEAMSNGIQFVKNEDFALVKWGRKHMPKWEKLWHFYSGKSGIGRMVQTSFLFYGGLTTFFLTAFAIRFDVFDGTLGRSLVGNLSFIGFNQMPGGEHPVLGLSNPGGVHAGGRLDDRSPGCAGHRMARCGHRRNPRSHHLPRQTRHVYPFGDHHLYRCRVDHAAGQGTDHGGGSVLRRGCLHADHGHGPGGPPALPAKLYRTDAHPRCMGRRVCSRLVGSVFVGQIVGKWEEGGWIRLISFTILFTSAHLLLISPLGHRSPEQIRRIVRDKARIQGAMGSIVEWQSVKMQQYRYSILVAISRFWALFGVIRPVRYDPPPPSGDYDHALHVDHPEAPSFLDQYIEKPEPRLGGAPKQTEQLPPTWNKR